MNWKSLVLAVILLSSAVPISIASDDFQSWDQLSLKLYHKNKIDIILFSDARFTNNAEKLSLYFISPRIIYHVSPHLDLGFNYTYLQSRKTSSSVIDDSFNWQHRAEFEVNPQWTIGEQLKLKMRNRVEFRWIEDHKADNTRYRQRWGLEYPLTTIPLLKSVFTNSEFFYDFSQGKVIENRTVPIGFNFTINKKTRLSLYYMIQSQKGTSDWASNQILGTTLSYEF